MLIAFMATMKGGKNKEDKVMRENILWKMVVVITAMLFPAGVFASKAPDDAQKANILKQAYSIQVPFIENMGQVKNKDVSFYAKIFGGTVFVEKNGVLTYKLPAKDKKVVVIKEIFTEKRIKIAGSKPSPTRVNCFIGKDKKNWRTNIPSYDTLSLGKVYRGIDLSLRAYGNNVEKLFTVLPEEDPKIIKIKVTGCKELKVNEKGELELMTEPGSVKFTKPFAYQNIGGKQKPVEAAYIIYKGNTYGFKVGSYDKKRPLIIDPLLASTFIGGDSAGAGCYIAIDGTGDVYVTGYTYSSDFPTTPGAYDESQNGICDVFVSRLDSSLSTLGASTFIGGGSDDSGRSIAIDGTGDVYITGKTDSSDFPTTPGVYDASHDGCYDVFISKLDSSLSTLPASTFIGGGTSDCGNSIAIDGTGDVYVTGDTKSSDFPTTDGAYDTTYNGNSRNIFVAKFDSNLCSKGVTTTTTVDGQNCPTEVIYGEYSKETELLRYLRDNILSQAPEGQEIIRLYYEWSPAIVKAMEGDEAFKDQVKDMIDGILILIRAK